MLNQFIEKHKLNKEFTTTAQEWFIPLADVIEAHHNSAGGTYYVAINGCQGSGKSTLTAFLTEYLTQEYGLKVANLSLDDFYFSHQKRQSLASSIHPLLATRGVPGTHDMVLLERVLKQLGGINSPQADVAIPRFNKGSDDPCPIAQWPVMQAPADIVIFEGWCWGVKPQLLSALHEPVNALEAEDDKLGIWRQYVNRQLENQYLDAYALMDYWIMLKAPSFDVVYQWRQEQEEKLRTRVGSDAKGVMSDTQIARFIQFYQRLTEHALKTLPDDCDQVFELDGARRIIRSQIHEH